MRKGRLETDQAGQTASLDNQLVFAIVRPDDLKSGLRPRLGSRDQELCCRGNLFETALASLVLNDTGILKPAAWRSR